MRTAAASFLTFALALAAQARTWDFSTLGETDKANLNADAAAWKYDASGNRWLNQTAYTEASLKANGNNIAMTDGLLFTATGADNIRIDDKKKSVTLNKSTASFTIPGLKAGDKVTVTAQSSNSSTPRALSASNLSVTAGFKASTDRADNTGTVTADGDVTISTPDGGYYIYSVTVDGEGGGTGGEDPNPPAGDHAVRMNTAVNQMALTTAGNDIKYYNTAEIASVDFDKTAGSATVTPVKGEWTDQYVRNVTALRFAKAETTAGDGEITNSGVNITEAKGWMESLYAKWTLDEKHSSYRVYVKGGDYADYTPVDRELVRRYPAYGRVDIPGLPAGRYTIKVVPVANGQEDPSQASVAADMAVAPHDRSGFAFKGAQPGAYDADGRLKKGARVLYITKDNAKTVSLDMTVSTNGATETRTGIQNILQAYEKGVENRPLAIRFIGKVSDADTDELLGDKGGMQIKGKTADFMTNVTLEGIGDDATLHGFGLVIFKVAGVEVRNLGFLWFKDDGFSLKTGHHVWVHHNDLFYGQPGSASDQAKGDGTLDVKDNSQMVTFSYNHLWDSGKASLCGMKSESGPNYIDYHHNWFDHSDSRHPRVRTMSVHVWNNYYDGVSKYGVGAAMKSNVFVENNYFRHTKYPVLTAMQGSDLKGGNPKGTFSGEDSGVIKCFGNIYTEGSAKPVDYRTNNTDFDCYEAESRDEQVPSAVKGKQGGRTYDNFDTDSSVMHTYTPDSAADVPAKVKGYYGAGRLNKGDFSWEFGPSEDTNYSVITALSNAIKAYQSTLVGIFE